MFSSHRHLYSWFLKCKEYALIECLLGLVVVYPCRAGCELFDYLTQQVKLSEKRTRLVCVCVYVCHFGHFGHNDVTIKSSIYQ